MEDSNPPIVVGIRQTSKATKVITVKAVPEYIAYGSRVATATRKIIVRPTSNIVSAISFGVFCRFPLPPAKSCGLKRSPRDLQSPAP